jgi:hypothetical protein
MDEFDDIILDDYNFDVEDNGARPQSSLNNADSQEPAAPTTTEDPKKIKKVQLSETL